MSDHDWLDYDETHKACLRCGLRLFWSKGTAYGQRGWVLVDFNGVTSPNLLGTGSGKFGRCTPPERTPVVETVLIDYTGDPEIHPSCERYMHRLPPAPEGALLDVKTLVPVCGYRAEWWELGPSRDHVGWSWCLDCWGHGKPRALDQQKEICAALKAHLSEKERALVAQRRAMPAATDKRTYCYCPKCAGGLPPRSETIRDIKAIRGRKFKMKKKELRAQLVALLEQCPGTAYFLEGVNGAIESLYADDEGDGCPEGFEALDAAVTAFDECEEDAGDEEEEEEYE